MKRKKILGIMLTLFLIGMLTLAFNVQPVKATGTIYIRADGSIDPPTAPISSLDNVTYTITDNIYDEIVIERSGIMINGNEYVLQGSGQYSSVGFNLTSVNNVVVQNTDSRNFYSGIWLNNSSDNTIANNRIDAGYDAIFANASSNNKICDNHITASHGIVLVYSKNNTISRNDILDCTEGMRVYLSSNNTIYGNNVSIGLETGLYFYGASHNVVYGNDINNQEADGIGLWYNSSFNVIYGNTLANNWEGMFLYDSCVNNTIYENDIIYNERGVAVVSKVSPSNNTFYHNNFDSNAAQVYYVDSTNTWDNGYPSGGNYWSDYVGVDLYSGPFQNEIGSDGIGDTPYVIDGYNQDNYPLANPWTPQNAIEKLINDVENMNLQQGIENSLDAKLTVVLHALEALNADQRNDAINKLNAFINEVEAQREKKLTNEQADYLIAAAREIIDLID